MPNRVGHSFLRHPIQRRTDSDGKIIEGGRSINPNPQPGTLCGTRKISQTTHQRQRWPGIPRTGTRAALSLQQTLQLSKRGTRIPFHLAKHPTQIALTKRHHMRGHTRANTNRPQRMREHIMHITGEP